MSDSQSQAPQFLSSTIYAHRALQPRRNFDIKKQRSGSGIHTAEAPAVQDPWSDKTPEMQEASIELKPDFDKMKNRVNNDVT
jgi:hypothetical protein